MESSSTYYMIAELLGETVAIELRDAGGEPDVWRDLEDFDDREGTNLSELLRESSVLDIVSDLSSVRRDRTIRHVADVDGFVVSAVSADGLEVTVQVDPLDDGMTVRYVRVVEDVLGTPRTVRREQELEFATHELFVSAVFDLDTGLTPAGWEAVTWERAEVSDDGRLALVELPEEVRRASHALLDHMHGCEHEYYTGNYSVWSETLEVGGLCYYMKYVIGDDENPDEDSDDLSEWFEDHLRSIEIFPGRE